MPGEGARDKGPSLADGKKARLAAADAWQM
jgi:hypothetical protein